MMAYQLEATTDPEQDPQGYLERVWARFEQLGPEILDLQHRAALVSARAREAGDLERAEQAKDVIRALHNLGIVHMRALDKARELAPYVGLGGYGVGAVPVAALAALSGLALLVAWVFRAYAAEERKLELIEQGVLTPEQAAALDPGPQPGGVLGDAKGLLVLAGLIGLGLILANRFAFQQNPPLVVYGANPPGAIGEDVHAVYYRHADDGELYVHEFAGGVHMDALEDGTVLLSGPRPLWEDFGE